MARGLRRQTLPRRHQLLVGQPLRPREPAHQRRRARAVRPAGTRHLRRLHASARGAARRRTGAPRARRPQSLLLRRQRLRGHRSGREDELSLLAQHRPAAQDTLHHAVEQLPRRDAGRARGGQRGPLQVHLPPAAHGRDHGALARCVHARARSERGRACAPHVRAHGSRHRAESRRGGRGHRRAAGAMRRRHAHVRPGLSQTTARGLRPAPGASHRR